MTRAHITLLLLLAGTGWACAFAVVGIAVFRGYADHATPAAIFAAFGFAAGAGLAAFRLGLALRLGRAARPARAARRAWPTEAGAFQGSVFGA